jgi:hypothetical protein
MKSFFGVLVALSVGFFIWAKFSRVHLSGLLAEPADDTSNKRISLPWVKFLLVATPIYFGAMYWASFAYVRRFLLW